MGGRGPQTTEGFLTMRTTAEEPCNREEMTRPMSLLLGSSLGSDRNVSEV